MENYSQELIKIRKTITEKLNEINELNNRNDELWNKINKEINDNKIYLKKQEGLSGITESTIYGDNQGIIIIFQNRPTAKGLSIIEDETGLKFIRTISEKEYLYQID